MIRMQISVISLMILLSPWLCSSSVVNMSCSTREFGKCVKTQLQLVCSNYGSREFILYCFSLTGLFLYGHTQHVKGRCGRQEGAWARSILGTSQHTALQGALGTAFRWLQETAWEHPLVLGASLGAEMEI